MIANRMRAFRILPFSVGLLCAAVNALLLWPVLARFMSPSQLGAFASALAAAGLFAPILTGGVHVVVLRDSAIGPGPERDGAERITSMLMIALTTSAIALSTLAFWSGSLVWAVSVAVVSNAAALLSLSLSRGLDRAGSFALQTLTAQTLGVGSAGALLAITKSLTEALLLAGAVVLTPSAVETARLAGGRFSWMHARGELRVALRLSLPLVPHLVLLLVPIQGIRLLVAVAQGTEAAALFQFAAVAGGLSITTIITVFAYFSRELYAAPAVEFAMLVRRASNRLSALAGIIALLIAIGSLTVLSRWLPAAYPVQPVLLAIACLLPAGPLQAIGDIQSAVAMRARQPQSISPATASGALAATVVVLSLGESVGVAAGGMAVTIGLLFRAVVAITLVSRQGLSPVVTRTSLLLLGLTVVVAVVLGYVGSRIY